MDGLLHLLAQTTNYDSMPHSASSGRVEASISHQLLPRPLPNSDNKMSMASTGRICHYQVQDELLIITGVDVLVASSFDFFISSAADVYWPEDVCLEVVNKSQQVLARGIHASSNAALCVYYSWYCSQHYPTNNKNLGYGHTHVDGPHNMSVDDATLSGISAKMSVPWCMAVNNSMICRVKFRRTMKQNES